MAVDVLSRHREWIGKNPLRVWREANQAGAMETASMVGVSPHAVYAWESGASRPSEDSMDVLDKIIPGTREAWDRWESERPGL